MQEGAPVITDNQREQAARTLAGQSRSDFVSPRNPADMQREPLPPADNHQPDSDPHHQQIPA